MRCRSCLITIVFILIASKFATAASDPLSGFHPVPHEGYEVKENKIYMRYGNSGLIVEIATEKSIASYYLDRGIQMGNPFRGIVPSEGPSIFIITILNRGKGTISFTPSYVLMKVKDESFFPMDYGQLWGFISSLDPSIQKVMQQSIYNSPESVRSGEVMTKLLIFPAIPRKMNEFALEFDFLYLENHEFRPTFYFNNKEK